MLFQKTTKSRGAFSLKPGKPRCAVCELYRHCQSPKMPVSGKGKRGVLFIANHPTAADDKTGVPFSGAAGREIQEYVESLGFNPLRDCWWSSSIACHSSKTPTGAQVGYCRPLMMETIDRLKPSIIIPMGRSAVQSLMAPYWKESLGSIDAWVGWQIPSQHWDAWVCPAWSPGDFREPKLNEVRKILQQKYIEAALSKRERPWGDDGPPDYMSQIDIVMDTKQAARDIDQMISLGGAVAIDYETTTLKPHGKFAQIVTCSVCWNGEKTIAFPWDSIVAPAVKRLLASPLGIIAANIKFEETWGILHLDEPMNNPVWDTMQSGHVNRVTKRTAGLKFQTLVEFGQAIYDDHIKPFLTADRPNLPNRIRDCPIKELLLYNGMDSLMEWMLAERQISAYGRTFRV